METAVPISLPKVAVIELNNLRLASFMRERRPKTHHAQTQTCTERRASHRTELPPVSVLQSVARKTLQALACVQATSVPGGFFLALGLLEFRDVCLTFPEEVIQHCKLEVLELYLDSQRGVEVPELKVGQGIGLLVFQAR